MTRWFNIVRQVEREEIPFTVLLFNRLTIFPATQVKNARADQLINTFWQNNVFTKERSWLWHMHFTTLLAFLICFNDLYFINIWIYNLKVDLKRMNDKSLLIISFRTKWIKTILWVMSGYWFSYSFHFFASVNLSISFAKNFAW